MNYAILARSPLFSQIDPAEYEGILQCLQAYQKQYQEEEAVCHSGDQLTSFGIVLSGFVHVIKQDFLGNNTLLASISCGQLFAESFAFSQTALQVSIYCAKDADILWIPVQELIHANHQQCRYHAQLVQNMLQILANKNQFLTHRIEHLSKRTIKEKVLSYLVQQAISAKHASFTIPFDRQELADYLCVDRSALSYVLSSMQKEGILTYHKNSFTLQQQP